MLTPKCEILEQARGRSASAPPRRSFPAFLKRARFKLRFILSAVQVFEARKIPRRESSVESPFARPARVGRSRCVRIGDWKLERQRPKGWDRYVRFLEFLHTSIKSQISRISLSRISRISLSRVSTAFRFHKTNGSCEKSRFVRDLCFVAVVEVSRFFWRLFFDHF